VDRECYAQALLETLEMEGLSTDWDSYTHVTDESIVRQAYLGRFELRSRAPFLDGPIRRFTGNWFWNQ
jgi:hypothetical protein